MRTCVALLCTTEIEGGKRHCLCASHYRFVPFAVLEPVLKSFNHYVTNEEQGPAFHTAVASMNAWIREGSESGEKTHVDWETLKRNVRARDEERERVKLEKVVATTPLIARSKCPVCGRARQLTMELSRFIAEQATCGSTICEATLAYREEVGG